MDHIDKETFNILKERMKAKFPILLGGYLRDAKAYMVAIETNVPNGSLNEIIEASHSLKSASGLLGIVHVHGEAERVEYTGKELQEKGSSDLKSLQSVCSDLKSAFSAVEDELRAELKKAQM